MLGLPTTIFVNVVDIAKSKVQAGQGYGQIPCLRNKTKSKNKPESNYLSDHLFNTAKMFKYFIFLCKIERIKLMCFTVIRRIKMEV